MLGELGERDGGRRGGENHSGKSRKHFVPLWVMHCFLSRPIRDEIKIGNLL